jgi:hypothetical protein
MYHIVETSEADGARVFRSMEQYVVLAIAISRLSEIQEMNPNLKFEIIAVLT